jgi:hypothetical protein
MLAIFGIAITRPLNNLIPGRMAAYTLVWLAVFTGIYIAACFVEKNKSTSEKRFKKFLPVYLVMFGILLFAVSCCLRSGPISDYENVYWAAYNFANGLEIDNWDYFARWTNNVGYMLFLAMLFFPVSFLNNPDVSYYFVLLLNVLQVVMMLRCIVYLAGKISVEHSFKYSFMALVLGSLWLPLWANTSVFYSDQLSLGTAIFGMTFMVRGYEKNKSLLYSIPAGFFFAAGVLIKATSATLFIAGIIACILFCNIKGYVKELAVSAAVFILILGGFKLYSATLPYQENSDELKAPVEYWLALGINGNGTYAASEGFAIECLAAADYDTRKEIARQEITDNIDNLWNIEHILSKTRQNFGIGDFGASGYLIWPENENILWEFVSSEGIYYWKYACLTTSFFFAWLLMSALGGLCMSVKRTYYKKDMFNFTISLSFWGLALFLMLWEAQNKQMYNHSGIMIMMLVTSVNLSGERISEICGNMRKICVKKR